MNSNDTAVWELISPLIEKGDILVDVGANTGIYTELFSKKLENTGKIFSIELSPETFSTLKSKFENEENIVMLNCAISDSDSEITYYKGRDSLEYNSQHSTIRIWNACYQCFKRRIGQFRKSKTIPMFL